MGNVIGILFMVFLSGMVVQGCNEQVKERDGAARAKWNGYANTHSMKPLPVDFQDWDDSVGRAIMWNEFADAHHLERMTPYEAQHYENRDIRRAMLAVRAHLTDAQLNIVSPHTHQSGKQGEVEE